MGGPKEHFSAKALQFEITSGVMHAELHLLPVAIKALLNALDRDHPAHARLMGRFDKANDATKMHVSYQFFSQLLLDTFEEIVPHLEEVALS